MSGRRLLDHSSSLQNHTFRILARLPFDFALYPDLCLRGQSGALPYIYSRASWRCIVRTTSGKSFPVRAYPCRTGEHMYLVVEAFSDFNTSEEHELKDKITQMFCLKLDLLPFYRKTREDPEFFSIVRKLRGLRPYFSQDPYEALIKTVVRQLIRADMARQVMELLVLRFGTQRTVSGETYHGFPLPEDLSKANKNDLIRCKLGYKWRLIRKISRDVARGDLDLHQLTKLNDELVIQYLTEYDGIGYWSSRMFLYDGLRRLNSYPIRDISLRRAISLIFSQGKPIPWEEVESFFRRYKEFVGIATTYLFGAVWLGRNLLPEIYN